MSQPLCLFTRPSPTGGAPELVCQVSFERTAALVAALAGVLFIGTALYLFLGGIGTIPAITSGSGLLLAGLLFIAGAVFATLAPVGQQEKSVL